MKSIIRSAFPVLTFLSFYSCSQSDATRTKAESETTDQAKPKSTTFDIDTAKIMKDFMSWYNYTYQAVRLSKDFKPIDENAAAISKMAFLDKLLTGDYVAFRTGIEGAQEVLQLHKPSKMNEDARLIIKEMAATAKAQLLWEGKLLPEFNFTDVNGNSYNSNNTRGKVLVIKCWFIRCVACVEEFPELNRFVGSHAGRADVKFISLATDDREDLIEFLKDKPFSYAVVPSQNQYITDQLKANVFPTHVLVNREGKVVKVANGWSDIEDAVEKEVRGE
jgi:thiol-disulfide isomerase/thioredoxin